MSRAWTLESRVQANSHRSTMSYILDALRRADADRVRGTVPDIHAQPVLLVSADAFATARAKTWATIAAVSLVGLIVAWSWIMLGRQTSPEAARPIATTTAPGVETTQAINRSASAADAAAVSVSVSATTFPAAPPARRPSPSRRLPAKASVASNRVMTFKELPRTVQRALPTLLIGGSVYSKDAASRFLMVNGQVLHEGDKLAPDLMLESIRLKAAVFKYKNYRYELEY